MSLTVAAVEVELVLVALVDVVTGTSHSSVVKQPYSPPPILPVLQHTSSHAIGQSSLGMGPSPHPIRLEAHPNDVPPDGKIQQTPSVHSSPSKVHCAVVVV